MPAKRSVLQQLREAVANRLTARQRLHGPRPQPYPEYGSAHGVTEEQVQARKAANEAD